MLDTSVRYVRTVTKLRMTLHDGSKDYECSGKRILMEVNTK